MRGEMAMAILTLAWPAGAQVEIERILARVSEEAEVFRQVAPDVLGQETLWQRARKEPLRFQPRQGNGTAEPQRAVFRTREIVSEYGFSTFGDAPNVLHEFRQVVSVDGREVGKRGKARQALAMGMKSRNDRLKRRLLEQFERYGLRGAATDFGQLILLFEKRRLGEYQFQFAGKGRIGPDEAVVLSFRQTGDEAGITIFEGRKVVRRPLRGLLWAREPDFLPLRITLTAVREQDDFVIRDEATVDYAMSAHGVLLPASVVHRQLAANQLVVENVFQYSSFRKFSAETDIEFTEAPLQPLKDK